MSKGVKILLLIAAATTLGSSLLLTGVILGRLSLRLDGLLFGRQVDERYGPGGFGLSPFRFPMSQSWDWHGMRGRGMMNRLFGSAESPDGGWQMGPGMMGGYGGLTAGAEPLTIDQARQAVENSLDRWGEEPLAVGEIMIFDNHAYAQLIERDTGAGGLEVLVDPVTLDVYPEMGPNMMWNLKYSMMGWSGGRMGGMMGGFRSPGELDSVEEMPVSAAEAVDFAQRYLDDLLPAALADEHADAFYGYYTLHVVRNGEVVGMVSVNGFTGEVFLHTWHGKFVEMSAE